MQIQKPDGIPSVKESGKNTQSLAKTASQTQTAKPSVSAPSAVLRSAAGLASAAGLPADKLSSSIVSFARFFSLPVKPQVLADIRRQAFSLPVPQSSNAGHPAQTQSAAANPSAVLTAEKIRQTLSLSAAAAESKGVEMNPKGLESYAEAVDPELRRRQDGERERRRRNREQNEQAEKVLLKAKPLTADILKNMAFEYAQNNSLLDILNRLPGKNGQRWIVLPFDFIEDNSEFRVSMRVLVDDEHSSNRAVCMALDVAEFKQGNDCALERRWLFVMESANEKPVRVSAYLQPELPQNDHSRFKNELSVLLALPLERVSIKTSEESFPEVNTESFPPIDEAV
ncbi:MAG: hypothetical protein LBI28_13110 [Treponema sp.]|jgi:hypothetical protein|nr:hypothetical protein [Treponema sp.]